MDSTFTDLVCFSHLRWSFVFQRPQHLLSRFVKHFRVFYIEETIFNDEPDKIIIKKSDENVWVITPTVHHFGTEGEMRQRQKNLLSNLFEVAAIKNYVFWYYTPMPISISEHLDPKLIVYDCMDELSTFKSAPACLKEREEELMSRADVVFTGGNTLYEAKKHLHKNIHPFPSSIDKEHFSQARTRSEEPFDQAGIPHPRIGFFGVIDERMDIDLVAKVAFEKPEWHFVMIGPIVKINRDHLPTHQNIHYLGSKSYTELPNYLAGWDIAMIPFAKNESTRFISPTKTPEYLAAGKPVISTSIQDVVAPYGNNGLVYIADTPEEFIKSAEFELSKVDRNEWLKKVDSFLLENSWDKTWRNMMSLIMKELKRKSLEPVSSIEFTNNKKEKLYV